MLVGSVKLAGSNSLEAFHKFRETDECFVVRADSLHLPGQLACVAPRLVRADDQTNHPLQHERWTPRKQAPSASGLRTAGRVSGRVASAGVHSAATVATPSRTLPKRCAAKFSMCPGSGR